VGAYIQDKIGVTNALSVQPGVRFDYYEIIDRAFLQPRLNISYALNPVTMLRGAWGIYRQSPGYEKLLDQQAFYDFSQSATGHLTAEQAMHYVLGVERWLTEEWQVKVEGYLKNFDKVIVQEIVPGTLWETSPIPGGDPLKRSGWTTPVAVPGDSLTTNPINGATGQSYGVEFLLEKKNIGPDSRVSGWIGYAWARADRVRGNISRPFQFDQRHTVDVVLDYRVASWLDIGVRFKYGSNFPYTAAIGLTPRIVTVTQNGKQEKMIEVDAGGNVIFDVDRDGEANKFRAQLPAYHRLDVRLTAKAAFWEMNWTFYLDVINVYNHQNVLNYNYYQGDGYTLQRRAIGMLPIIPTLGFSAKF
jgi:outer membrane receptor for ferrienterochelin and colicin